MIDAMHVYRIMVIYSHLKLTCIDTNSIFINRSQIGVTALRYVDE